MTRLCADIDEECGKPLGVALGLILQEPTLTRALAKNIEFTHAGVKMRLRSLAVNSDAWLAATDALLARMIALPECPPELTATSMGRARAALMEILEQSVVPPAYSPGHALPGPGVAGLASAAKPEKIVSSLVEKLLEWTERHNGGDGVQRQHVASLPQLNELWAEVCGSYKFPNTTRTAPNVLKPLFDAQGLIDNAVSRSNVSYDTATGGLVSDPSAVAKVAAGREEFSEQVIRFLSSCALVSAGVKASPTVTPQGHTDGMIGKTSYACAWGACKAFIRAMEKAPKAMPLEVVRGIVANCFVQMRESCNVGGSRRTMSSALVRGAKVLEASFHSALMASLAASPSGIGATAPGDAAETADLKRKLASAEGKLKKLGKAPPGKGAVSYEYEGGGTTGKYSCCIIGTVRYEATAGGNSANPRECRRKACAKPDKCVFSHAKKP